MITVIDYGAGNLRSVENTLKQLGVEHRITSKASEVVAAEAILLPGVGHFGQMMRSLETLGLTDVVRKAIRGGIPYLGICLGMQALYDESEEAPAYKGLGIFPGTIRRFQESGPRPLKIPHMGWNQLQIAPQRRLFDGIRDASFMYFAHSYYLPAAAVNGSPQVTEAAAEVEYGARFVAAIEQDNIYGVQFHPEKSGDTGLKVVANFAQICSKPRSTTAMNEAAKSNHDAR